MTEQPALSLRGVTRTFGGVVAVHDVDLDLPPGERRALLGPNGAGKTTLVNLIAGSFRPTSGTITLFGHDVTREPGRLRVGRGMARTYQQTKLFDGLTVLDSIGLALVGARRAPWFARGRGGARTARDQEAEQLAVRVGLGDLTHSPCGSLSHGGKRQLELAMALAAGPALLVLDEPAAGLSPSERQMLGRLLIDLPRDITVLLIEHDMNIALAVADRTTVMADGKIVFEGTPHELTSSEAIQALYLGSTHA